MNFPLKKEVENTMNKKPSPAVRIITILSILAIAVPVITGCSKREGTKIIIRGSTTVLPIAQKAAEAYRKSHGISISIEGSGSGNGIKSLLDGTCDIANSSRELKEEELALAASKGMRLREIAVGYDMIVPVVHPSNPVTNLSIDQLRAVYDGSITDWKDLGGRPGRVVVVSRDTSSGTYEIWEKKIMNRVDVRRDALLQASNGAILSTVSENPQAIGYIGFGYMNNTVKALKVNGIPGTIENGKTGKFPVSRKLYMVVNDTALTPRTASFLDFILGSDGQKLVEEAGYIPL